MSEYTNVYLRRKDIPMLEYRKQPSREEIEKLTKVEIEFLQKEIEEYNDKVSDSYGCLLFYLSTTLTRGLYDVLPWTSDPQPLTIEMIDDVIAFFDGEIEIQNDYIKSNQEQIERMEARIVKVNLELYDKIDQDINDCYYSIKECQDEIENYRCYRSKFAFVKEIMEQSENSDKYEVFYTND